MKLAYEFLGEQFVMDGGVTADALGRNGHVAIVDGYGWPLDDDALVNYRIVEATAEELALVASIPVYGPQLVAGYNASLRL